VPNPIRRVAIRSVGILVAALTTFTFSPALADDSHIRLNTIGFLPDRPKRASVAASCSDFRVIRDADGVAVFTGRAAAPLQNPDTAESLAVLDFSPLRETGVYRLEVPGVGRSPPFRVAADVYDAPFRTAVRAMYLWRCGAAVEARHNGHTFSHAACHQADAFLDFVGGGRARRDAAGGWHDAGDYNKYVVNAAFSLGVLFQAWDHFSPALAETKLNVPTHDDDSTPDFLAELRWELDWLLKMQADDGRVHHKISTLKFGPFVLPEHETADRYFSPWSSSATAGFAAAAAMAARHFSRHDKEFAARCLAAARRSHSFLAAHPADHRADLSAFSTGPYQASDAMPRLWATVEMWETTGEAAFLHDFETRARALDRKTDPTASWANVKNLAMYTYALSEREGRDPALLASVRAALVSAADDIVNTAAAHGYARPLGARYFWGCNGDVAQQVQTLHVADQLQPNPAYTATSLDALAYLFGRNVHGRSYVTGVGHRPPHHPHDRRSGADTVAPPWPGYLIGGGWPKPTDWKDEQDDYRTNEIAINWNATLIYALAKFLPKRS
jgi:endoglucanase